MALGSVRYAVRLAFKSPVFTAVAVASLAIAIGANSAVFTLIDSLLLRPLPLRDPSRLVAVEAIGRRGDPSRFAYPHFEALSRAQSVFSEWFAYDDDGIYNVEANGSVFAGEIVAVSGEFYRTLGITTRLGRPLTPEDDGANGHPAAAVAVISDRLWHERYASDPNILGKTILLQNKPFVIVGVNRPGFYGLIVGYSANVIITVNGWQVQFPKGSRRDPASTTYEFMGRLKPGVSLDQARAQLEALWPSIRRSTSKSSGTEDDWAPERIVVNSGVAGFTNFFLRRRYEKPLFLLFGAVAILLLIACVNLANLTLARSSARSREMAIRISLGAPARVLVRQCLTESLLLSITGASFGIGLAYMASRAIAAFLWIGLVPLELNLLPDIRILAFTACTAVVTGILFGLAPAWNAARQNPALALQQGTRVLSGGTNLLARMLIVAQMALSIALLTGATMFAHSLIKLRSIQLGFQSEHVLSAQLMPRPGGHTGVNIPAYYRDLLAHIRSLPGVATASLSAWRPVEGMEWEEPVRTDLASTPITANRHMITASFFETVGMHVFEGRDIQDSDTADKPPVAVISHSLALRLFPTGDAVGHRITLGRAPNEIQASIIGVVSNANLQELRHSKPYAVYLALYQQKISWPVLNVRTHIDPETVADGVRRMIRAQGREFALSIETVNAQIDHSFIQDRLLGYLSTFFSMVALLLASVGLYGLLSFAVARRTAEIGIRMALGAEPGVVTRMVLGESLRLVLGGTALGLGITIPSSRLLSAFLYDPTPHDPIAIVVASGTLLAVAIAASWLPARRAAATDPMSALRTE